jgi:hypothetical protein
MSAEYGTVTQTSPLLVMLDSDDEGQPALRLAAYTPAVDDRVAVVQLGKRMLCLGKVV